MKFQKAYSSTFLGVLVLILFYFFLIALILGFSRALLVNITTINLSATILVIVIIALLIIFLIGSNIFIIITLIKERTRNRPGTRLKTRLILLFAFIILISLIPQSILSIYFINLSINFWFKYNIIDVLEGGNKLGVKFYTDKVENLQNFSSSPLLTYLFRDIASNPERMWRELQSVNPELNFIQVFDAAGRELYFKGENPEGRMESISLADENEFLFNKEGTRNIKFIRRKITNTIKGIKYHLVLGMALDNQFTDYGEKVSSSLRKFKQLDDYKPYFEITVIVFYVVFNFPIFLLTMLISFLLTGEIIRPIVHLEEATRRVAEGDFSFRILTRSNDELSLLVNSFNKMVSELASSRKKLIHAEKIAAWQEIARRLAHEIKNPLTPIKLSAQRILKKYEEGSGQFGSILESSIASIIDEVEHLTAMLGEFSDFAKLPRPVLENVNLKEILEEVSAIYRTLSSQVTIDLQRIDSAVAIFADKNQLKQVFGNLFKNAIEAMPEGGEINLSGDIVKKLNVTYYRIQLKDTGSGIDESLHEDIFNPYVTTKRNGTGLGLAIVESIVFDHNGNIWFESKKGAGTTFFLDLPMGSHNE